MRNILYLFMLICLFGCGAKKKIVIKEDEKVEIITDKKEVEQTETETDSKKDSLREETKEDEHIIETFDSIVKIGGKTVIYGGKKESRKVIEKIKEEIAEIVKKTEKKYQEKKEAQQITTEKTTKTSDLDRKDSTTGWRNILIWASILTLCISIVIYVRKRF